MKDFLDSIFNSLSNDALIAMCWIAAAAFIVFAIVGAVSAICLTDNFIDGDKKGARLWGSLTIAMTLLLLVTLHIPFKVLDEINDREYEHITECIESGYTLYINGEETDISHITLESYSRSIIEVHDDIKEVHIAANK